MTTMELIHELRAQAEVSEPGTLYNLLHEAADRLESLEERCDIMSVDIGEMEETDHRLDAEIRTLNRRMTRMERAGMAAMGVAMIIAVFVLVFLTIT